MSPMTEAVVTLEGHSKRVGILAWHPSAFNILLTAGNGVAMALWRTRSTLNYSKDIVYEHILPFSNEVAFLFRL